MANVKVKNSSSNLTQSITCSGKSQSYTVPASNNINSSTVMIGSGGPGGAGAYSVPHNWTSIPARPPSEIYDKIIKDFPYETVTSGVGNYLHMFLRKEALNRDVDYRVEIGYEYIWFKNQSDMDRFNIFTIQNDYRYRIANNFGEFLKDKYDVTVFRKKHQLTTRLKLYPVVDKWEDLYYEIIDFFNESNYTLAETSELFSKTMLVAQIDSSFIVFLKDESDAARLKFILDTKQLAEDIEF